MVIDGLIEQIEGCFPKYSITTNRYLLQRQGSAYFIRGNRTLSRTEYGWTALSQKGHRVMGMMSLGKFACGTIVARVEGIGAAEGTLV